LRTHPSYLGAAFIVRLLSKNRAPHFGRSPACRLAGTSKGEPALTISGYSEGVPVLAASLTPHAWVVKT
jgi:hypothetical protein